MSVQIFLQGKLTGIEGFAGTEPAPASKGRGAAIVVGRCRWVSLLTEVLPRAVLGELGLARILLGWSGGGAFFLVLPQDNLEAAVGLLRGSCRPHPNEEGTESQ